VAPGVDLVGQILVLDPGHRDIAAFSNPGVALDAAALCAARAGCPLGQAARRPITVGIGDGGNEIGWGTCGRGSPGSTRCARGSRAWCR
jgi:hypothetical protein